jgi:glycine hydroxymethyltransferase
MEEDDLHRVGELIGRVLRNLDDEGVKTEVREEVHALCEENPLYPDLAGGD